VIFGINITHVYTYIMRTLFFSIATCGHLSSNDKQPDRLCPVAATACSRRFFRETGGGAPPTMLLLKFKDYSYKLSSRNKERYKENQ